MIYKKLLEDYGPQGWWPLVDHAGSNPTKSGSVNGYHPGDYSLPKTDEQVFEICIGAILTQNTSWPSVEKALLNLKRAGGIDIKNIKKLSDGKLKELIKPAGYYNQKADYIREFVVFFEGLEGVEPSRKQLLDVKGIGPETADSILLFAFKQPSFVVDAYTRRIFVNLGLIDKKDSYDHVKKLFEDNLDKDYKMYQEYHALLVEHAKRYYQTRDQYHNCPLYKKIK